MILILNLVTSLKKGPKKDVVHGGHSEKNKAHRIILMCLCDHAQEVSHYTVE